MISQLQQIALYQSDPKLIVDDELGTDLLQKYSECWSPEEIQLYYQVMLQGRQDLLICPDEASGFEMLMLRLLAFSPQPAMADILGEVETGEVKKGEVKKKPEVIVAEANYDARMQDASVLQETRESAAPGLTMPQPVMHRSGETEAVAPIAAAFMNTEPPQAESLQAEPPQAEQKATKSDPVEPEEGATEYGSEADAGLDWSMLAYKLGLTGISQELVANSQFRSFTGNRFVLQLPGELYELVNDLNRAEILQALQQKLGVSLHLELTATTGLTGITPLQAKQQREHDERVSAIAAIRDDEVVRKLQHVFDAELDEASVVKIDSNG